MTNKLELYRCNLCMNVVSIALEGAGSLVCCNEEMELLKENTADEANPHFAHIENIDDLTKKITINHMMTPEHHIEFVEVISNDKKYFKRKYFEPEEPCQMIIRCECKEGFYVRLYCNKDDVWVTK